MIFRGSRYRGVNFSVLLVDGDRKVWLHNRDFLSQSDVPGSFTIHTVTSGQTLDEIANLYGGKTRLWWLIADVNNLGNLLALEVGQELLIPEVSEFAKR